VELLIVLAIIALLAAMLLPSLSAAREQARRVQCAARLRSIHTALWGYAVDAQRRLPPFAFETFAGNLPASGHWGGSADGSGVAFGRRGVERVNLAVLVAQSRLTRESVVCPGGDVEAAGAPFSSYCLRFPPSEDLFATAEGLAYRGGDLLGIYRQAAGGVEVRVGREYQTVPQVRLGGLYAPVAGLGADAHRWDPMADALLADGFWGERAIDHLGGRNACFGDGAVKTLPADDPKGKSDEGVHRAGAAETIWRAMDARR
jgi:hypothetical protein